MQPSYRQAKTRDQGAEDQEKGAGGECWRYSHDVHNSDHVTSYHMERQLVRDRKCSTARGSWIVRSSALGDSWDLCPSHSDARPGVWLQPITIQSGHGPRGPQPLGPRIPRPGLLDCTGTLSSRGDASLRSLPVRLPIYTLRRDHRTRFFPLLVEEQGQLAAAAGLRLDRSGQASREGCLPGQPFLQLTRSVRQRSSDFTDTLM